MSKTRVRLILEKEGKVLLLRQTKKNGGSYTLVGGKIDPGETALQALVRESWEEAGVILKEDDLELVHTMLQIKGKDHKVTLFFKAKKWKGELETREPDKFKKVAWHKLKNLPNSTKAKIAIALDYYQTKKPFSEIDILILAENE
ncbi:MAG TPA: NUDIX domain-containing protein [Saprospiraceae bacterium]|nr:NUDIX domain-containing protein [Saprospiraceae bacterium]